MSLRLASRWPLILAAVFCTYSVVLLWDAFQSKEQLKAAADARMVADSKRRAAALSDFGAELRNSARLLAQVPEVRNYYVNKALGMSARYGLNANLDAIAQRFSVEVENRKQAGEPVLHRVVLLDEAGIPLADTRPQHALPSFLFRSDREEDVVLDRASRSIVVSVPVDFKGASVGTLLAVIDQTHLHHFLVPVAGSGSTYRETLFARDGSEILFAGGMPGFSEAHAASLLNLPEDRPLPLSSLELPAGDVWLHDLIGIKTSVETLPVVLLTTVGAEEIYGRLNSPVFLYSLSLFPILVLLVALRLDRMQVRATRLAIEAAESDSRRKVLQGQNTALFEEVQRRQTAERELERHQAHLEDLVRQRTAELNSLFLALPDLYFRLNRDGEILDYRSGNDSDLLLPPQSFLGRRMQDVLPPDVAAGAETVLAEVASRGKPATFEYGLAMPAGQQFYEARILPLGSEQMVVVVRNVTARHALEEQRDANRREAERLARVKSEFLANMSHEIRTPLNGILGMAQIGYRESAGRDKSLQAFSKILDSGKLLLGIVNDVLDFSKIEAGKLGLESVPIDLHRVLRHACEMVDERAQARGIDLVVRLADDLPPYCIGDPVRLEQILLNLLGNAVKFTERGRVVLSASRDGGSLLFAVSDTGIGMNEDQLARLYTPFEQADGSTTRRFGGTGLGLAIVKRLVELMGGTIAVTSRVGAGSRFDLRVPYVEAPAAIAAREADARAATEIIGRRLAGMRLLVAEDAEINQLVIQAFLGAEGAEVVMVGDGRQAVERIAEEGGEAFDLALLDIQMPVMDGYEATRLLRQIAPSLPVVGQTAHALAEERARCFEAGMIDHVAKPIDAENLVTVVLRHAKRPGRRGLRPRRAEADPVPTEQQTVDWYALQDRLGARPGFAERLAATLVSSQRDVPSRLRAAIEAQDLSAIAGIAHKLRGVAGNVSLTQLQLLAGEVESAARQDQADAIERATALLTPLEALLAQTEAFLAQRKQAGGASTAADATTAEGA